jgi:hypothetical protein
VKARLRKARRRKKVCAKDDNYKLMKVTRARITLMLGLIISILMVQLTLAAAAFVFSSSASISIPRNERHLNQHQYPLNSHRHTLINSCRSSSKPSLLCAIPPYLLDADSITKRIQSVIQNVLKMKE